MKASDLPQLAQFFGGWFHQDWTEEGSDWPTDVVRAYMQEETPKAVRKSIKEIEALLASRLPPTQMRRLIGDELGCAYDPTADGKTFRAWLREVHEILRKSQAKK
jgi:CdiI immunity protein